MMELWAHTLLWRWSSWHTGSRVRLRPIILGRNVFCVLTLGLGNRGFVAVTVPWWRRGHYSLKFILLLFLLVSRIFLRTLNAPTRVRPSPWAEPVETNPVGLLFQERMGLLGFGLCHLTFICGQRRMTDRVKA